jgi:hypothetical protein
MASDPLKDTSVEEAQREIYRRLLRQEKLKRIEAEEMRRLAATGWKPPIERTATGGPSVHDAAAAIEETERRRRAYAQEAQRRAEARQHDPTAARDEFEVRRRAQDQKDLNKKLDEIETEWRSAMSAASENDFRYTADMLKHYLDRSGRTVHFMPAELRAFDIVNDAEKRVQQHFVDWMIGPSSETEIIYEGDTIGFKQTPVKFKRIASKLLAMKEGESLQESEPWESVFRYPLAMEAVGAKAGQNGVIPGNADLDLFGFAGNAKLRGDGNFLFTRRGNQIEFRGQIEQGFDEPYNFETGTEFPYPDGMEAAKGRTLQGEDARQLALHSRAAEFRMKSHWPQQVTGVLDIGNDGKLRVQSIQWIDVDPLENHPWP